MAKAAKVLPEKERKNSAAEKLLDDVLGQPRSVERAKKEK